MGGSTHVVAHADRTAAGLAAGLSESRERRLFDVCQRLQSASQGRRRVVRYSWLAVLEHEPVRPGQLAHEKAHPAAAAAAAVE